MKQLNNVHPAHEPVPTPSGEGPSTFLERLMNRVKEAERAHAILVEKGYGKAWMPLEDLVKLVPAKPDD